MSTTHTRRDVMKLASAALPALAQSPSGEIQVRQTWGEKRYAEVDSLKWKAAGGISPDSIVLDPLKTYQEVLGFGSSFTDAACYMFNQLAGDVRERLFYELFHPSEMGLNISRICVGSSDYAVKAYSFDEGEPDPEMKRFSIDHDKEYILPMLRQARKVSPELFLLASPWSPPGWMKAGGTMLGGSMRQRSFPAYAKYFVKFLEGYMAEGVPVQAVTVQNEVDTDQDGRMPACLWAQEYEMEFVARHLGPQFAANEIATKIWILDHNYNLWGRAVAELDDPIVNKYVDGIAWHGYVGVPSSMSKAREAHPEKHMYWTEGGADYKDPHYLTDWTYWGTTYAGILRNWARCVIGWNMTLDEAGQPNIGPFTCGGMLMIDSKTKEITRSGMYWAIAHHSRAIRRGAKRLESSGGPAGVTHVAFGNPDGGKALVLTNSGEECAVRVRLTGREAEIQLPAMSISTLTWKG